MFVLQAAMVKGRGGIATAVGHYERMFRAMGVRSAVVFKGPSAESLRAEGVDLLDAPELLTSPIGGVAPLFGDLRRAIEARARGEPILAIVHSDLALPSLRRLFPHAIFATPCHSDKFKHKRHADLVITLNRAQHELAAAALPGVRCALLGNPYVAAPPETLTEHGVPRLNFVARFTATKDPMTLLAAASLLRTSPPPEVRFIGAGGLEAEIKAAASARGATASFPGWLNAPFSTFHRNDVLVLPSHWEGLPYLLQEALDHGIPIVASANAGNMAALGDGAFGELFPVGDAGALARVLEVALADLDGLRGKAEKGRQELRARYGADRFWRDLRAAVQGDENA